MMSSLSPGDWVRVKDRAEIGLVVMVGGFVGGPPGAVLVTFDFVATESMGMGIFATPLPEDHSLNQWLIGPAGRNSSRRFSEAQRKPGNLYFPEDLEVIHMERVE